MRKLIVPALAVLFLAMSASAQHDAMTMAKKEKAATLMSGLGSLEHPVATTNAEAQRFFNQGLALVFAFNHEEAVRSFKRAAELDPKLAMAYWGIALSLGPNINLDVDPAREKAAYEAVQAAVSLAANASENERAYINALAKRYSIDPKADLRKLDGEYKQAMAELVKTYPDDLDAATLYAESAMDLRPWKLWTADGRPAPGTEEIISILESVLRRKPDHPGAIHYYIHAVEASPHPERALAYAEKLGALMPAAGHIVHMPAHIYQRTGDYEGAIQSNKEAAAADRTYLASTGSQGLYGLMYYSHNLHFLAIASVMQGRVTDALNASKQLDENVSAAIKEMPMLEGFLTVTPLIMVHFQRWDDIKKIPAPSESLFGLSAVHHFARGMAMAATGDIPQAEAEAKAYSKFVNMIPADAMFGLNPGIKIMNIADKVLAARLAAAKKDDAAAIDLLKQAVAMQDALAYDEPPTWFAPVREMLGGALLKSGDAAGAEKVFRADLEINKRNGRSLFGLMESLKAQKKDYAAQLVQRQYEEAWKKADSKLKLQDLW